LLSFRHVVGWDSRRPPLPGGGGDRSIPPLAEAPPMVATTTPFPGQLRDETPRPGSTGAMLSRPAYGQPFSVIVNPWFEDPDVRRVAPTGR